MNSNDVTGMLDTIIIGGGQAGLTLGHHLKQQQRNFLILDANQRSGDAWRQRWDSLRVFTPAKYDGLPGQPFPADPLSFPTKDEVADYLEGYAERNGLPVHHGARVERLWREGSHYVATTNGHRWEARNAVVATGVSQAPNVPGFAVELAPATVQLHSSQYRNPGQLQDGPVLVVGLGNSGAEIALEVARTHPTTVAGKPSGELPVKHGRTAARYALPVVRFLGLHVLTLGTPVGRKAAPTFTAHAAPLIRTKTKDLAAAGVRVVPRMAGVEDGQPVLADGARLEAANVIWCTGFRDDFSWIDPGLLDGGALPRQHRGVALDTPGLFFLGQEFLYAAASATLPGVGRDARYLARKMPRSVPAAEPPVSRGSAAAAA
ncbi:MULTISPECIES: NAD(P)/FAD-dependent oxidoreductase [unclassified Arthrobacter]|uniref:flavin-containing monooxygenase n=1 Tax=unclassified Arthrobacter TaxID=235627 RepID=UPI001C843BB4|nr:NAD(P)-binding domain-containing protein [Arthrobacter sp. MAHUQ-56]MBX7445250.1 NAD(P)/FAD-dependent oxidoreductase [Arthrobacter sp. MAHUQ-56]